MEFVTGGHLEFGYSPSLLYPRAQQLARQFAGHEHFGLGRSQIDCVPVDGAAFRQPAFAELVEIVQFWKSARFIDEHDQYIPGALGKLATTTACFRQRERSGSAELYCWAWPGGWQRVGCRLLDTMLPWSLQHVQEAGSTAAEVVTPLAQLRLLGVCPAFDLAAVVGDLEGRMSQIGHVSDAATRPRPPWVDALLADLPALDDLGDDAPRHGDDPGGIR